VNKLLSLQFQLSELLLLALLFAMLLILCRCYSAGKAWVDDLTELRRRLHFLLQRSLPRPGLSFNRTEIESVWQLALALSQRARSGDSAASTYSEALSLGTRIVSQTDNSALTADNIAQLLFERTRPEVMGVAVVLVDPHSGNLELSSSAGLPGCRFAESLLIEFDQILREDGQLQWGYHTPERNKLSDMSAFGISLTLRVPIRIRTNSNSGEETVGVIWLGFKHGADILSAERRALVHAIAEHAAASLTVAQRVQKKQDRSTAERDYLIGLSHDLRAPGNSALYAVQDLLLDDDTSSLTQLQRKKLLTIENAVRLQLEVVGDVLDLARHEQGLLQARAEVVELGPLLREVVRDAESFALAKSISIEIDEQVLSSKVVFERRQLKRILGNFISNAIKYSSVGKVIVSTSFQSGEIEVSVRDWGMGVPKEEANRLFRKFERCTNGQRERGVGLGLALSKVLAELNNSSLFYQAGIPTGSIFGVRARAFTGAVLPVTKRAPSKFHSALIIDDDRAVCRTHSRFLSELASEIYSADNLTDAIQLLQQKSPELVIADLYLKEGSIEPFLKELKLAASATKTIILTGDPHAASKLALGVDLPLEILSKPTDRRSLTAAVERLLNNEPAQLYKLTSAG